MRELTSIEAEHGVLGALMIKPDLCEVIGSYLSETDFSSEDNQALYTLMLGCHSKKVKPDAISLADLRDELPSGEMTMIYAAEIARNIPSAANGENYARIVIERARARRLFQVGLQIQELAMSRGVIAQQIAAAQGMVFELDALEDTPDVVDYNQALGQVFDDMQDRLDGVKTMGIEFGLSDLDDIVRCLRPGNLGIIAGRPGTGKTVLGMNLAEKLVIRDAGSALVFSLEMSQAELAKRSLAATSGVSQSHIESGEAVTIPESNLKMTVAVDKMSRADIRICDKPALTFSRICAISRFQHRSRKLDLIVIDYLGLISPDPNAKMQNRNQELGAISRGLKALAKELAIPIVALAQLNRGIEGRTDKRPVMSDLRDSGEIEQDADVIIMAHRDMGTDAGRAGLTMIDAVKVRHAKPGYCALQFRGDLARFELAAQGWQDEPEQKQEKPSRGMKFK